MQVQERQNEVQKNDKCSYERSNNEKWRKHGNQVDKKHANSMKTNANQTRDQLDTHDFRKQCTKA